MFRPEYEPLPFAYAIRLPDHYPEGTISFHYLPFLYSSSYINYPFVIFLH